MKFYRKYLRDTFKLGALLCCLFFISTAIGVVPAVAPRDDNAKTPDEIVKQRKDKVTLLLDWKPNTNHTGFFVAKNKGYFKDLGLEVKIVNPSPTSGTTLVGTGKADFGISYATNLIHAREAGIPVIAIASIAQPDSSCFIWRKSSGIKSPKDFEGKTYAGWGSPEEAATLKFIMEKNGADFSKLKIVTVGVSDFLQSTEKNAQITWEYKAWGMLSAEMHGIQIGSYCPSEHFKELEKPSPLLITSENLWKKNPGLVKRFAQASQKGFDFAIAHPVEAAKILVAEVPGLDENFVIKSQEIITSMYIYPSKMKLQQGAKSAVYMTRSGTQATSNEAAASFPMGIASAPYWGYIAPEQFAPYENWMFEQKLISKKPDLNNFIVNVLARS